MNLDDQVCYCYHVSMRKLVNFARRENLQRASQMSQCLGAGTGCGWCIPILKRIYEAAGQCRGSAVEADKLADLPESSKEYADARQRYLKSDEKNTF